MESGYSRMSGTPIVNREAWLTQATERLLQLLPYPKDNVPVVTVSCGWPITRGASQNRRVIGECWHGSTTADGSRPIFISPYIADPADVLSTLAHEICHAFLPPDAKHKGPFKKLATLIGLEGKMTATVAGDDLALALTVLADELGPYPHVKITPTTKPIQTTRMLKATCDETLDHFDDDSEPEPCGYTVRLTKKWIDEAGYPICPRHGIAMTGDYVPGSEEDDD